MTHIEWTKENMFTTDWEEIKPVQIDLKCNIWDFVYIMQDNKIYRKEIKRITAIKEFNAYQVELSTIDYLIDWKLYKEKDIFISKKEILQYISDNILE